MPIHYILIIKSEFLWIFSYLYFCIEKSFWEIFNITYVFFIAVELWRRIRDNLFWVDFSHFITDSLRIRGRGTRITEDIIEYLCRYLHKHRMQGIGVVEINWFWKTAMILIPEQLPLISVVIDHQVSRKTDEKGLNCILKIFFENFDRFDNTLPKRWWFFH